MSKLHTSNEQKPENQTLASEIITDLKKENQNLRETVVTLALMLTKILKEGDLENGNA